MRALLARDPRIAAFAAVAAATQFLLAWLLADYGPACALVVAWIVGVWPAILLHATTHEFSHGTVFHNRKAGWLTAIITASAHGIPTAASFLTVHPLHHSFLGEYARDMGIPSRAEARLVDAGPVGKVLWLALLPIWTGLRLRRVAPYIKLVDRWLVGSVLLQVGVNAAVLYISGISGLIYLIASAWFSVSLHPLGARWVQEHLHVKDDAETNDYVGVANASMLNAGLHTGHHDFETCPGTRLAELYRLAPEFYTDTVRFRSYTALLFVFIFQSDWRLWRQAVRSARRQHE